jgi:hypothetical protein
MEWDYLIGTPIEKEFSSAVQKWFMMRARKSLLRRNGDA